MDLDALIARRPQLALVDELAHTNAPGSRHPKRYLDVEELLSHGIDVYTAVNIQHIESLNDVVAQITHVRVRETVPDSVFDRADAHRTDRPDAGRPDSAAEGGQGLRPQTGRARAGALFLAGQSDGAARTGAAAHRRAGRRAAADSYAGQCHRRPLGRGRAHPGLPQRGSARGGAGALHQAAGGSAACAVDRHQHRDPAQPAIDRRAARPARRHVAAGRGAGRRGAHHSRRRTPHRRRHHQLRAGQQRHPDHHRQVDPLVVVRDHARLGGARSGAARRQYQRQRHRRRRTAGRGRAPSPRCRPRREPSRSIPSPI